MLQVVDRHREQHLERVAVLGGAQRLSADPADHAVVVQLARLQDDLLERAQPCLGHRSLSFGRRDDASQRLRLVVALLFGAHPLGFRLERCVAAR